MHVSTDVRIDSTLSSQVMPISIFIPTKNYDDSGPMKPMKKHQHLLVFSSRNSSKQDFKQGLQSRLHSVILKQISIPKAQSQTKKYDTLGICTGFIVSSLRSYLLMWCCTVLNQGWVQHKGSTRATGGATQEEALFSPLTVLG